MTNFQGFSPESFEQLVRALAVQIFGPGVTVFGNGPDGGREASFRGRVNYPYPSADQWSGYGVIQAKFKERQEGARKEQQWAAKQLRTELERWRIHPKRAVKPEYYVFCTNVELTSGHKGGREVLEGIVERYASGLGIKGFALWDGNQLHTYIDVYPQIRARFTCLLTAGDLVAQIARTLPQAVEAETVLTAFLSRELLSDEDARLSQAGDRSEDRIRLAEVFVDLPSADAPTVTEHEEDADGAVPPASVHELAAAAAHKLDPLALAESHPGLEAAHNERVYGRYLFIGGPGSGKSTLGQFLAQAQRAALLERRPRHRIEPRLKGIIGSMKARFEELGLAWPSTPRLPMRVELNAFAKALASSNKEGVQTLSEYLRRTLSPDGQVSHADLREWLKTFSWLFVFDGLDEVPSSSNRRQVVLALQAFVAELRDLEADVLIVASSRPDGYEGEFDGEDVKKLFLTPLSKRRALDCADRYIRAKSGAKADPRAQDALDTIKSSIENALIARLMTTPLQVTFMVTVVAASGKPSESRWQLFNDYYRTIYERELHKAVRPFDRVLSERRQDIDALHYQVGFVLQCRAECSGGTQSELQMAEFEEMVDACLRENGLEGPALSEERDIIVGAAKLRLVFLTSRSAGRLSFDVRSLQEYMAAAYLTNVDVEDVIGRLKRMAHSAYWKNTFLFAVGRFFVEPRLRSHRDRVRLLCEDLNREEPIRALVKLGSRLALEILESGAVGNVPLVKRSLAECALGLLADPCEEFDDLPGRLASLYEPAVEQEFSRVLAVWLGQALLERALRAWMVLLRLEEQGVAWAVELAEKCWPTEARAAAQILRVWFRFGDAYHHQHESELIFDAITRRLVKLVPELSIVACGELFEELTETELTQPAWLANLAALYTKTHCITVRLGTEAEMTPTQLLITSLEDDALIQAAASARQIRSMSTAHQDWINYAAVFAFIVDPSSERLAGALECFDQQAAFNRDFWLGMAPWPLAACLAEGSEGSLATMAMTARAGRFAEVVEWKEMERTWRERGIEMQDLGAHLFSHRLPLASVILYPNFDSYHGGNSMRIVQALMDGIERCADPSTRQRILVNLQYEFINANSTHITAQRTLLERILALCTTYDSNEVGIGRQVLEGDRAGWLRFFDEKGKSERLTFADFVWDPDGVPILELAQAYLQDRAQWGLLRLVAFWYAAGVKLPSEVIEALSASDCTDAERLSRVLLRMGCADRPQATRAAQGIAAAVHSSGHRTTALEALLSAIERHGHGTTALEVLLPAIAAQVEAHEFELKAHIDSVRLSLLQALPSGFKSSGVDTPKAGSLV